ncbi:MAG: dihydrodipicolinate synthase family protein [Sporolactobacillus sp.]
MADWKIKDRLKGVFVLAITPMKENGAIHFSALTRNINHFIDRGADGIVVGGTYAEYPSMTFEERKELFFVAAKTVKERVPLICCTAASGTSEAIELTKLAKEAGADGVMVTAPYVAEVEPDDIFYHFKQLNDAVDLPIFIYNSASIGITLSPELISRLADLPNVVGVKHGSTDMRELIRTQMLAGDRIAVMAASDSIMLGALALGLPGCTSTNANFMVDEFIALKNELNAGKLLEAQKRFYRWQPVWELAHKYGQPAMVKAALDIVGLPSGPVRAPFRSLDQTARQEIQDTLRKIVVTKEN